MDDFPYDKLVELELKYKFYVNEHLDAVFYSKYDARKFVKEICKVRAPQYTYRINTVCDDEGFEVYVIYVGRPYKIYTKE